MTNVKQATALELSDNISQKHIAQTYNNSPHTIHKVFSPTTKQPFIIYRNILHSMILNLVTTAKSSGMSMILMDSATHRVLDIMLECGDNNLHRYFEQYSCSARAGIKTITVDLFGPYQQMIHDVFPHAQIIADRFHIVTQVYRALKPFAISSYSVCVY